ncbi:MAG: putative bile acid beta-glucosidase [Subtercola sp.]|nr:putative bile acid beta-glucosidase [Subtercola sp.]
MLDLPVLTSYDQDHLSRISLPIGGIGTGTVGLGGRGDLRDFELGNRPAKGFRPGTCLFAIRVQTPSGTTSRLLEGPLSDEDFDGDIGSPAPNQGLPRFASAGFHAAYPFGQVTLHDPDMPEVTLEAFNPLVPADVNASSMPAAILRYRVRNTGRETATVSIVAAMENFIGKNGTLSDTGSNANTYKETDDVAGVVMTADLTPDHEAAGTFSLATLRGGGEISHRLSWSHASWGNSLLDFWDDFIEDGILEDRASATDRPIASLVNSVTLEPESEGTITFLLTWNFPHRRAWRSEEYGTIDMGQYTDDVVGNYYSELHPDPWECATQMAAELPELEARTRRVTEAILATDAPTSLVEAALYNISTLRSPTVFRTADGRFYGWEGVRDYVGSCFGTCTHVWGYEFATSFWFSDLAWSFRETQYLLSTSENGLMSFRAGLPLNNAQNWELAAADGQMATLVHLYLDWQLSGDTDHLRTLWPAAKRSLEFAWIAGGWDADKDGVMEGCQHNTMDVEYYGPNPQMQTWYLAALRSGEEMARALGDEIFAAECARLFQQGSAWTDDHLFNGRYYEQHILPVSDPRSIAPGLRHEYNGAEDLSDPDLQLGKGVLIDQLVGQYAARIAGLGTLLDEGNVRTTLDHIFASNFRTSMAGHFNHMRGYALGDEAAVLMCTYEAGTRPKSPFPYFNEVMTGFEYTLATNHIQDGDRSTAITIIDAIRRRFNGARRNPFDETECGRHYARAMASWSAFVSWTGFHWNGLTGTLTINLEGESAYWSTGSAAGTIRRAGDVISLEVLEGDIDIRSVTLNGTPYGVMLGASSGWLLVAA